jgi:pimeloyl-ACP methyl ester carboxylesterase
MDEAYQNGSHRVILVHGITGSRRFFSWLEDRLHSGAAKAETLSFDLVGFGDNKDVNSDYSAAQQLRFMNSMVEEHFPLGRLVLIGHSLGGVLALAWTVEHLSRVSHLVLLNTPLGESREDIVRSLERGHLSWASLLLWHKPLAHLTHLLCVLMRIPGVERAFRFLKPSYVPDEVFEDYVRHSWRSLQVTFDEILLNVAGGRLVRQIHSIPVLNLMGQSDDEISRRSIDQANVDNIVMPGGHLMLLEHPLETSQVIERFLTRRVPG